MPGRHVPSDFWFVFGSTPFCILVGDKKIIVFAFDRWRSGDPSVAGLSSVGGIVAG